MAVNENTTDAVRIKFDLDDQTLPLGLGIQIGGGRNLTIIEAGSHLPIHHTQIFSTEDSYQMAAEFNILFGDRPLARDNISLGRIRVRNIKWSAGGEPKIELSLEMDKQGVLTITANNKDKKRNEILTFDVKEHVTKQDIVVAIDDIAQHAEEDARHRAEIDDMLDAYRLRDDAYEHFSVAKRKMGFAAQRSYKSARKRLASALDVMPPEATEQSMAELRAAVRQLRTIDADMQEKQAAVEGWYK